MDSNHTKMLITESNPVNRGQLLNVSLWQKLDALLQQQVGVMST
jgi:hypothetical protein